MNINQDPDIDENQDDTFDKSPIPPKSVEQIKQATKQIAIH